MKIHEYQAKQLLAAAGVKVPRNVVARTPDEAAAGFSQLAGELAVVKSQIHAGGRGKGRFKEQPTQPGVVLVKSADAARDNAAKMLGNTLVTIQTGEEGKLVSVLLIEEGLKIAYAPAALVPTFEGATQAACIRENGLSGSKLRIRRDVAAASSNLAVTSDACVSDAASASTESGFSWSARSISRLAAAQFQSYQRSTIASAACASASRSSSSTAFWAAALAFGNVSFGGRKLI